MPKTGRNDSCPCGSGKKYKHCCLNQAQAARRVAQRAGQVAMQANRRTLELEQLAAFEASMKLDRASNAVVNMINAGQLDQAEHAARQLLVDYPEVHDGYDRLGMVYQARGMNKEAADYYRQAVDFIRAANAEGYGSDLEGMFLEMIAKLDPPAGV